MNQKELNKYLKYIMSLSDKDREALYSKHTFRFSNKELSKKLKDPLTKIDKSPYREFDGGYGYDTYFPQITINNITEKPVLLHNGITIKKLKRKK